MKTGLLLAAMSLLALPAMADMQKPLYGTGADIKPDRAVLYFDSAKADDLNLLASFIKDCKDQAAECYFAEASKATDDAVKSSVDTGDLKDRFFRGTTDKPLPRIEIYKGNAPAGSLEQDRITETRVQIYLGYVSGSLSKDEMAEKLASSDSAGLYKATLTDVNRIMNLSMQGKREEALAEMAKVDTSRLDSRGRLFFGQTYMRLRAYDLAVKVLSGCTDVNCVFYLGVAQYLGGDSKSGLVTLKSISKKYGDKNRLNWYLKKMYEAEGDKKHADGIKLPEGYNINN